MPENKSYTVGLGILSWRAHKTLLNTLHSYAEQDLFSLFDKCLVYFQDISDEDRDVAARFGLQFAGGPNIGIGEGMRKIAQLLDTDYVLNLENDCPLIETRAEALSQLNTAVRLLEEGRIDVMRLRHRWSFGEGFALEKYTRLFPVQDLDPNFLAPEKLCPDSNFTKALRRTIRPFKAVRQIGRSVYVERSPDTLFPKYIKKSAESGVYIVDSSCINWTNQSVLFPRDLFLNTLMPYVDAHPPARTCNGFWEPEVPLNNRWWRRQHFRIGVGKGLFTHVRHDGRRAPSR